MAYNPENDPSSPHFDPAAMRAALDVPSTGEAGGGGPHTHDIADVTGLQTALDGKAASSHNHDAAYEAKNANIQAHIASPHAPPTAQKNSDILKAEIEAVLTGELASHTHPADGTKADKAGGLAQFATATTAQPLGYAGASTGGAITQQTNKTTGVTLNKLCGQITMNGAALAAAAEAKFTVTNNQIAATDVVIVNHASAGTSGAYAVVVTRIAAGAFDITVTNLSAGSLSEAIVINFAIIKAVNA